MVLQIVTDARNQLDAVAKAQAYATEAQDKAAAEQRKVDEAQARITGTSKEVRCCH